MPHDCQYCLCCKYFILDPGTSAWSENTPGTSPYADCLKGVFVDKQLFDLTMEQYRDLMLTAQRCTQFEHR